MKLQSFLRIIWIYMSYRLVVIDIFWASNYQRFTELSITGNSPLVEFSSASIYKYVIVHNVLNKVSLNKFIYDEGANTYAVTEEYTTDFAIPTSPEINQVLLQLKSTTYFVFARAGLLVLSSIILRKYDMAAGVVVQNHTMSSLSAFLGFSESYKSNNVVYSIVPLRSWDMTTGSEIKYYDGIYTDVSYIWFSRLSTIHFVAILYYDYIWLGPPADYRTFIFNEETDVSIAVTPYHMVPISKIVGIKDFSLMIGWRPSTTWYINTIADPFTQKAVITLGSPDNIQLLGLIPNNMNSIIWLVSGSCMTIKIENDYTHTLGFQSSNFGPLNYPSKVTPSFDGRFLVIHKTFTPTFEVYGNTDPWDTTLWLTWVRYSTSLCYSCTTGKYLTASSTWQPWSIKCKSCFGPTSAECNIWNDKYYLASTTWNDWDSTWATCNGPSASQWTSCSNLYQKFLSNYCFNWSSNCLDWSGPASNQWTSWKPATPTLVSGTWKNCHPTCADCSGPNSNHWISCTSTSNLVNGVWISTIQWAANWYTCSGTSSTEWLSWISGFYFDSTPHTWNPWDSSCKSCIAAGNTQCTECNALLQLVNSAWITCHASCSTCSGTSANQWTGWANAMNSLYQGTWIICEASCLTCTGVGSNNWLTCSSPTASLYQNTWITCHSSWLTWSGATSNDWLTWLPASHILNQSKWIDCISLGSYQNNLQVWTEGGTPGTSNTIPIFLGWWANAKKNNDSDQSPNKVFTIKIDVNQEVSLTNSPSTKFWEAFDFSLLQEKHKTTVSSEGLVFTIELDGELKENESIEFDLKTNTIGHNMLLDESNNITYMLVQNRTKIKLEYVNVKSNLSGLQRFADSTVPGSRIFLMCVGSFGIVGSSASTNFGGSFIKIFQIIEIFGKLYYIPVIYTDYLNFYLNVLNKIGDFIEVNPDLIIKEQTHTDTKYFGKLSDDSIDRNIFRSYSVFAIIFILVDVVKYLTVNLTKMVGKRQQIVLLKIQGFLWNTTNYLLQLNFIDFVFYSSFGLVGSWNQQYWSAEFMLNKAFWLYLLLTCAIEVYNIFIAISKKQNDTSFNNKFYQLIVSQGIKENGITSNQTAVRALNPIFMFKMFIYQVLIVGIQNSGVICVVMLLTISYILQAHFFYVLIKSRPFENMLVVCQRTVLEVAIFIFLLIIALNSLNDYTKTVPPRMLNILDISVLSLICLSILLEVTGIFLELALTIKNIFLKWKKRKLNLSAKSAKQNNNPKTRGRIRMKDLIKNGRNVKKINIKNNNIGIKNNPMKSTRKLNLRSGIDFKSRLINNCKIIPFDKLNSSKFQSNRENFLRIPITKDKVMHSSSEITVGGPLNIHTNNELDKAKINYHRNPFNTFEKTSGKLFWMPNPISLGEMLMKHKKKGNWSFFRRKKLSSKWSIISKQAKFFALENQSIQNNVQKIVLPEFNQSNHKINSPELKKTITISENNNNHSKIIK